MTDATGSMTKIQRRDSRQVVAREKEAAVLQLRKRGMTFEAIARELTYKNAGTAYEAFKRAMARLATPDAEELRNLQVERLNEYRAKAIEKMDKADAHAMPKLIESLVRVEEREAKLLGLDAPESAPPPMEITIQIVGVDVSLI